MRDKVQKTNTKSLQKRLKMKLMSWLDKKMNLNSLEVMERTIMILTLKIIKEKRQEPKKELKRLSQSLQKLSIVLYLKSSK